MDATAAFENLIFMSDADSGCSDADSEKAAIKDALSESSDDSDSSNDSNAMEIEDMEKIINADTTKWEEAKFPPSCERLGYTRKAQYMFSPDEKPSEIFKRYFSDEIIKQITRETNKYAECYINSAQGQQYLAEKKRSKVARWKDINEEDIRVYLGINMLIGIVRLPSWREYWDSHSPLLVTNIPKIMNYTKYDLINKFLQVDASATFESALANQNNKIKFFKLIVDNFQKMVIPNENLTIDERVCRFKGRFHSKVYMPLKPDKWGIKLICLCDSNGLVLKLHFAIKGEKHSHVDDIMFDLLQNYSNYNHKLFLDNYFCHPELIEKLVGLNIFVTGTVRMNRRDLPKIIKDAKLKRGETFYYTKGNLSAIKAKENRKPFVLMTSFDSFEKAEGEDKSKCIRNYNKFMKGVDIMNQYCSYYR